MITKYYYSAEDITDSPKIALVDSAVSLQVDRIPTYSLTDPIFREVTIVHREIDGTFLHNLYDGISYHHINFNYVLNLDSLGTIRGFTELDSRVSTEDFSSKTIRVKYDITVVTEIYEIRMSINYIPHEGRVQTVHKKLFDSEDPRWDPVEKKEIVGQESDSQIFTSNALYFMLDQDSLVRYSGNLMDSEDVFGEASFDVSGYDPEGIVGFTNIDGHQVLLIHELGVLYFIYDEDNFSLNFNVIIDFVPISCSDDMILSEDNYIYLIKYLKNSDFRRLKVGNDQRIIQDGFNKEYYFYSITPQGDYKIVSGGLDRILQDLQSGVRVGNLLATTSGLAIYNLPIGSVIYSHEPLVSDLVMSQYPYSYYSNKRYGSIYVISNKCFIANFEGEEVYNIFELDSTDLGEWTWKYEEFGTNGYWENIFMIAKTRNSTPFSELWKDSYRGNFYRFSTRGVKTIMESL